MKIDDAVTAVALKRELSEIDSVAASAAQYAGETDGKFFIGVGNCMIAVDKDIAQASLEAFAVAVGRRRDGIIRQLMDLSIDITVDGRGVAKPTPLESSTEQLAGAASPQVGP